MVYYVNEGSVYAIGIAFPVLCTVATGLRFEARKMAKLYIGPDDWLAVVGLVFTVACGIVLIVGDATHTIGWHSSATENNDKVALMSKISYAFYPISVLGIGAIRLTFLFLYQRFFRYTMIKIPIDITIVVVTCWSVAFFFVNIFQCGTHFSDAWHTDSAVVVQHCKNEPPLQIAMMISDVVLDFVILLLPIVPVYQLTLSIRRRMLVLLVFSLGTFSIAASLVKIILAEQVLSHDFGSPKKILGLSSTDDDLGYLSTLAWWAYLEMGVGCLVSNLPPTMGLFRSHASRVVSRVLSRKATGSSTGSGGMLWRKDVEAQAQAADSRSDCQKETDTDQR